MTDMTVFGAPLGRIVIGGGVLMILFALARFGLKAQSASENQESTNIVGAFLGFFFESGFHLIISLVIMIIGLIVVILGISILPN